VTQELLLVVQGCHQYCDMEQNIHFLNQRGSGTFGTVNLVHGESTDEYVALKSMTFVEPESGIPGWAVQEVCLLQNLDHTNIAKLLRMHMDADLGQMGLTYQLVDKNVKEYVELVGPLVGPRLANLVRQCLKGLELLPQPLSNSKRLETTELAYQHGHPSDKHRRVWNGPQNLFA